MPSQRPVTLPPSSILLACWTGGAFLMGAKRLSEYRQMVAADGLGSLARYRRSFEHYDERSLTVSLFLYALLCAFLLAVFFLKYRLEYMVAFPAICLLFAQYLFLSFEADSVAQRPERLLAHTSLMATVVLLTVLLTVLTFVDIPVLEHISDPHFIFVR